MAWTATDLVHRNNGPSSGDAHDEGRQVTHESEASKPQYEYRVVEGQETKSVLIAGVKEIAETPSPTESSSSGEEERREWQENDGHRDQRGLIDHRELVTDRPLYQARYAERLENGTPSVSSVRSSEYNPPGLERGWFNRDVHWKFEEVEYLPPPPMEDPPPEMVPPEMLSINEEANEEEHMRKLQAERDRPVARRERSKKRRRGRPGGAASIPGAPSQSRGRPRVPNFDEEGRSSNNREFNSGEDQDAVDRSGRRRDDNLATVPLLRNAPEMKTGIQLLAATTAVNAEVRFLTRIAVPRTITAGKNLPRHRTLTELAIPQMTMVMMMTAGQVDLREIQQAVSEFLSKDQGNIELPPRLLTRLFRPMTEVSPSRVTAKKSTKIQAEDLMMKVLLLHSLHLMVRLRYGKKEVMVTLVDQTNTNHHLPLLMQV